jgi:tripartite-type tricarboxylate transporter receptor subunit TctC
MLRSDGCGWLLGAENRTGRRRCLPTARSLPFAWELGTSRWQLSDQTTPLRNGDPGIAQSQALYKNPLCNAATDFTPVVLITEQPTSLIVRRDLPAENLREFSAYAKANHAKMQFASAGAGFPIHLACVLVNINVTHVPYHGGAPAMQDLVAGRIDYLTATHFCPSCMRAS